MSGFESLLTGRELGGRYRIEEVIGRGGMGAVYRAKDVRLGRSVAVKVITMAAGTDAEARERVRARFRQEAASAARLPHHPNVVPVYDYGTDEALGLDFLVMELLRGEDLASRLQAKGPPPLGMALRILQHAAQGVAVGHRSGLIHRDVKPGNVFLVEDESGRMQVRVLDFGIAKLMADDDTQSSLTQDGRAPFSPGFASPEQLRGEARLTPASDVFSLGALGYQLLSGTRAFTDADRNRLSLGQDVPIPSLRARNPEVPDEVEQVIRRALAMDPAERHPDAAVMAEALDGPLRELGERPAASYIPVPAQAPAPPPEDDDDRTMLVGAAETDHTVAVPPPVSVVHHRAQHPHGRQPAIPHRRHFQPERKSGWGNVALWLALLLAIAAAAFLYWQAQQPTLPPELVVDDTVTVDTVPEDTLDAVDAAVLALEGRRFIEARDYPSALTVLNQAIAADRTNGHYRDLYAVALMRMGRFDEAEDVLVEAVAMDPRHDPLWSRLYEARLAQGDTAGAIVALEAFRRNSMDPAEREDARRRIEALRTPQVVVPPPPEIDPEPRASEPRDSIFIP
jgi:serine/threonine protein kinase